MIRARRRFPLWVIALAVCTPLVCGADPSPLQIQVGSKTFTESVILGEIIKHLARVGGAQASIF